MVEFSSIRWGLAAAMLCTIFFDASVRAAETEDQITEETLKKLSLEELTRAKVITESTLSRVEERVDEAPGSVYVYTREMIQNRGYRSLGELLQTVPGFTVFHKDLQFVTGVRGLNANDNEKTTILINGQNLNNTHEPDYLNGPINLDNVERVEVVVGPSAFFQQANTLAATINVITRDVDGAELVAAAGNTLKYAASVMAGKRWAPDRFVSLSFATEAKRGFDAWDALNHPLRAGRPQTGELDWPSFFGVLKAQYGDLSTQMTAYRSTFPELNINDGSRENNGQYVDQFYSLLMKAEHHWTDSLTSIIKLEATLKEITRLNQGGLPVNALELSDKQRYYSAELALQYSGLAHHFFQAGVQGNHEDNFDNWFNFNFTSPPQHIPRTALFTKDTSAVGFYLDDTYQPAKWLKIVGGVRVDHNGKIPEDRWFPGARAALIVQPTLNWVSKLMFNRAVRMPSAQAALNYVWGRQNIGDPADPSFAQVSIPVQQPEILQTFEWQNIAYFEPVRLGFSVYHEELENFISWFEPFTNIGDFTGNGAELTFQAKLLSSLNAWANVAYNRSTIDAFPHPPLSPNVLEPQAAYDPASRRLTGSPLVTANGGLNWEVLPNIVFSPSARYFTDQSAHDNATDTFVIVRNRYYLDATLMWRKVLATNAAVRLSATNLLDNRSPIPAQWTRGMYHPQGVSVVLGADLQF